MFNQSKWEEAVEKMQLLLEREFLQTMHAPTLMQLGEKFIVDGCPRPVELTDTQEKFIRYVLGLNIKPSSLSYLEAQSLWTAFENQTNFLWFGYDI